MQYAVELYFDQETETKLMDLARVIGEKKISTKFLEWKTRPHLTLACFNDVDEEKCIERLNEFAQKHNVMSTTINSIGMFKDTKTIFVSPTMNSKMYQLHRDLHKSLKEFDSKGWEWYCPDNWVPHCTIALTMEDENDAFYKASDLVLHEFKKLCGKFVSIGLVKITFPVEEIYTVKLGTEEITYEKLTSKNFNKCSLD